MTWPEFFVYSEAKELNKWEDLLKYRLMYVLHFNKSVKKQDMLAIKDFMPQPLDVRFLEADTGSITVKEALAIAQKGGEHKGRLGT